MKANLCEKGDSITSAHLKSFRTFKNKFDLGIMGGGVRKRQEAAVRLFVCGGGEPSSIRNRSKLIDE